MPAPKGHSPYNKKGEGGRPKKWDEKSLDELADSLDEWIEEAIHTKSQFWWQQWAFEVGTNPDKISAFAKSHERFRRSYEMAKSWQEYIIQRGATEKKFSEGFCKFMLINHYPDKWKDKSTVVNQITATSEILELASNKSAELPITNKE